MRPIQRLSAIVSLFVLTWAGDLFAWNDLGHMAVARIAYSRLSEPDRQAIVHILKQHPNYHSYFKKPVGLDIPEGEWLFMRAATWCDSIRPPRGMHRDEIQHHPFYQFHRSSWHYINYPYRAGQDTSRLPTALVPTDTDKTNILEQLHVSHGVLMGKVTHDAGRAHGVTDAQNRAIRLCWLFHLIGDLHQPLHSVALVNHDLFPGPNHGDNGGNLILIRIHATSQPSNLHSFWDNLLGHVSGWKDATDLKKLAADIKHVREKAEVLTHNPAFAPERLTEFARHQRYVDWAFESYQLAASTAYDHGNLKFVTQHQLDKNIATRDNVPVLSPLIQERAHAAANRRVALAGYRLAAQIEEIVAE